MTPPPPSPNAPLFRSGPSVNPTPYRTDLASRLIFRRVHVDRRLLICFVPKDDSGEAIGVAVRIMDAVANRRETLFPHLRKIIVDYDLEILGGRLTLNVGSGPIPELGKEKA
jgi:hypothetical protein